MSSKPLVSVVVLNWNGKHFLKDNLSSLMSQKYPNYKLFLVDNGSIDGSVEYVKKQFPKVEIIKNRKNLGYSIGTNIGFKKAKGKYVIALNNDTIVQNNFIEELVKVAESDEKIGSVMGKILQFDRTITYKPKFTNKFGLIVNSRKPQTNETFCITLANTSGATLYRKTLLDEIGGFDEYFQTDWEDFDLGFRISLHGFKNVYTPKTFVLHFGGASFQSSKAVIERRIRIIRNTLFTFVKNYEAENLILSIICNISSTAVRNFLFLIYNESRILKTLLLKGPSACTQFYYKRQNYILIFIAYWKFLRDKAIWLKRKEIQKKRTVSDRYIFSITQEL